MTRVAIIPARSGSKRITNKNMSIIGGKPAFLLAIENAKETGLFSEIIVSTDCERIASLATESGGLNVGVRPRELSDDYATTIEVIKYEISKIKDYGIPTEEVCCIYPVTPLLRSERVVEAYNLLKQKSLLFVVPVQESYLSEERQLSISEHGVIEKETIFKNRTQDTKKTYFDAGQFYWGTITAWENSSTIFSDQTGVLLLNKWETIDVDDPEDLEVVRVLYAHRRGGGK